MTKRKYEIPVNINDIIVNRMKEKCISNTDLAHRLQMHHSLVLYAYKFDTNGLYARPLFLMYSLFSQ